MGRVMRVACYIAVQPSIKQALGGLALATESAAFDKVGRSLKLASHIHQLTGTVHILLNRTPYALRA